MLNIQNIYIFLYNLLQYILPKIKISKTLQAATTAPSADQLTRHPDQVTGGSGWSALERFFHGYILLRGRNWVSLALGAGMRSGTAPLGLEHGSLLPGSSPVSLPAVTKLGLEIANASGSRPWRSDSLILRKAWRYGLSSSSVVATLVRTRIFWRHSRGYTACIPPVPCVTLVQLTLQGSSILPPSPEHSVRTPTLFQRIHSNPNCLLFPCRRRR